MRPGARTVVIMPRQGLSWAGYRDVPHYRDLLWSLVRRDVSLRYRQTLLGPAWVIFQPLAGALVFAFVLGRVAHLGPPGNSYLVFAYTGMLVWTAFSGQLSRASLAMLNQSQLFSKTYFPRSLLPLSCAGAVALDGAVGLALLPILMVATGTVLTGRLLVLPIILAAAVALALGVSLVVSVLVARWRDLQHVLPVVTQLLLFATPVAYATTALPSSARWVATINPLTPLLESARWAVFGASAPTAVGLAGSLGMVMVSLALGMSVFAYMERDLADVV